MMSNYVLKEKHGGYVCKGKFVVNGDQFKVLGDYNDALRFKTYKSAENYLNRVFVSYTNLSTIEIVEIKE